MNILKILIMDVDGTLTDGKINISEAGEIFKSFCAKDGYAIKHLLPKAEIIPAVITGRESKITQIRCKELGITYLKQGIDDKLTELKKLLDACGLQPKNAAYIGDDMNDYEAMRICGFKACPADAADGIRDICDYISSEKGGFGAVRDIIEHILQIRQK